jgi:hypothetical protein
MDRSRIVALAAILAVAAAFDARFFLGVLGETAWVDGWFPGVFVDFKNTWFAARLWLDGDLTPLFDIARYNAARAAYFPEDLVHVWSYPLHFLLIAIPFGLVSFPVAGLAWTGLNAAAFVAFVRRTLRLDWQALALVLLSSGFLSTVFFGQVTGFAAILLLGGLRLLPRRPAIAGICFGILTIKPHLGLLLPLVLVMERRWTAIASAVITTAVLVAVSLVVIGVEPWRLALTAGLGNQGAAMLERSFLWSWEPSWYAGLRQAGLAFGPAMLAQGVAALAACGLLVLMHLRGVPEERQHELVPLLTLFALPYVLPSDMVLAAPIVALALCDPRTPALPWMGLAMLQFWAALCFFPSRSFGVPVYPMLLTAAVAWFAWDSLARRMMPVRVAAPSAAAN